MTYDGEICMDCGFPVRHFTWTYWTAPDALWNEIVGTPQNPRGEGIILCPPCFARRAETKHIMVSWGAITLDD